MEEQNVGRHAAGEAPKGRNKRRKAVAIAVVILTLLLVGAYGALCMAAGGEKLPPHTVLMGVDLSGMTVAQAEEAVCAVLPQRWAGRKVALQESGSGFQVDLEMEGLMEPADLTADLTSALDRGNALARGGRYLVRLLGDQVEVEPAFRYTEEGQARLDSALTELSRKLGIQGNETTYEITDTHLVFRKGVTGTSVDQDAVRSGITAALLGAGPDAVSIPLIQAPPAEPDMPAIQKELYAQVSDAYLDRDSEEIVPSVTGKDLDIEAARIALSQTADGKICRVPLKITEPEVTTEELNETLFRDVLGEATTRVTGTAIRKENVSVAASHVNGTLLFPGEEFSFNQTCSPYAESNGYGKATAYVNGLSKDTVAGGVCQASSTLYWAVLKANLEVVDRRPHRYEPSYVKGGLDATVFGNYGDEGSVDFRFKNDTDYPVRITAEVSSKNYLTVTILGTDATGIHGEPYSTNRVVTQPYKTIYEASAAVPQGTTQKDSERTGYNGVTIDTYQKLVDKDGKTVSESKLYSTKYYCRNETILFNPADTALWGIDPVTGIRTEPTPTPSAEVPPAETGSVALPPETGSEPPAESQTPPPAEELPVIPPAVSQEPMLPPGAIVTDQ